MEQIVSRASSITVRKHYFVYWLEKKGLLLISCSVLNVSFSDEQVAVYLYLYGLL